MQRRMGMKKRCWIAILGLSMVLPAVASSCTDLTAAGAGPTFLRLFANPQCLQQYGITIPQ